VLEEEGEGASTEGEDTAAQTEDVQLELPSEEE
jgi:hypothetical protein